MARVRLTADVDQELRRRVKIAAASSDKTISEWIEDVVRREFQHEREASDEVETIMPELGRKP